MSRLPIFKMFGRSPIRPLQGHMKKAYECVAQLKPFFEAVLKSDWEEAVRLHRMVVDLEDAADDLKHDLRTHLPKSIFMPVPRSDILELIARQDQVANKARDIAGLVIGRHMVFPDVVKNEYMELLTQSICATDQAYKAIRELSDLFEVGFLGKELKIIRQMLHTLLQIERDTDKMQVCIREKIFALESSWPPVDIIFLYKVVEWTGDLANRAQHVGDGLEIVIAR